MKNFEPTPAMVTAANNVFTTMAWTQTVRPIVESYQREILEFYKWPMQHAERRGYPAGFIILTPRLSFYLSDEDFNLYDAECQAAKLKAGLKSKTLTSCPLLEAEELERYAKRFLIDMMTPVTTLTASQLISHNMDLYNEMVDLSLRLLAPYCNAEKILTQLRRPRIL